jgi:siroheme synthase
VIEKGLRHEQRVTIAPLAEIGDVARKAGVKPPAVIVIGEVVRLYREGDPVLVNF